MWLIFMFSAATFVQAVYEAEYEVPEAKVEPLHPRGFRVSIPDEEGIKLFGFHAKINEKINYREGGTFSRDITEAKNGRWTFYEPNYKLKRGDVIYYWTYIDHFDGRDMFGYINDEQTFVVNDLIGEQPTSVLPSVTPVVGTGGISLPGSGGRSICEYTDTVTNIGKFCKGDLIFNEDFNTNLQSSKLWRVEQRYSDSPDYEFVMYMNNPQTLKVNTDNILRITPVLSEDILGTGFITSREGFDFKEK